MGMYPHITCIQRMKEALSSNLISFVGQDLSLGKKMPLSPPNKTSSNPLPADEQQRIKGHAVAPAVAGKAPQNSSVVSSQTSQMISYWQHWHCYWLLLFHLLLAFYWDFHARSISSSLSKSVKCVSKSVLFCPRFVSMLDLTPFYAACCF